MLHIRPVSDLRNKFPEIEATVLNNGKPVYLTKNGYGSMVLLSLEQYAALTDDVELALDEADKAAEALLAGKLAYDPETTCAHHDHGEGHSCGEHSCGH